MVFNVFAILCANLIVGLKYPFSMYKIVALTTNGQLLGCPIAPDFEWNVLGDFKKKTTVKIGEPCIHCDQYKICGGRCLFTYKKQFWGKEGFNAICEVTKFLIYELEKRKKQCEHYKNQFYYPTL